jgi:putative two-component system response regulator
MVDDDVTILTIGKNVLAEFYNVFTMNSGARMMKMLEDIIPDLILLDVEMPGGSGYDLIKIVKNDKKTQEIPIIFLTAKSDSESELEGLSLGAIDYIVKPLSPPLLLKRLEVHLLVESQKRELIDYNSNLQQIVDIKTKAVKELQNAVIKTMAELVEFRDDITGEHIDRTQSYLRVLINKIFEQGIYREEISLWNTELVLQSAQLHDVGKIVIRDSILKKPDKLTYEEFEEIKEHTIFGEKVIDKIKNNSTEQAFLEHAKIFASSHHEKWNGSGYPKGLKGREIPLQGRLMAIADVYDALVFERPYKKAFPHEEAVRIIKAEKGKHFDPDLVEIFLSVSDAFDNIATLYKSGHSP